MLLNFEKEIEKNCARSFEAYYKKKNQDRPVINVQQIT